MEKYLMAIDAGTGSVRAVIFDLNGNQIASSQREWIHLEDPRYPNSMNFDWDKNWRLTRICIAESIQKASITDGEIAAVSTTCMREGIVLYDKDGLEIWACANVDARATNEVKSLIQKNHGLEKELYMKSGQSFALDALPRLLWVKNNLPDVYDKTAYMGMFNDWLIYKLCGNLAVEPSNGSTTGFINLETRKWGTSIAEKIGIKTDIFPLILEPGEIAGKVSKNASEETGLKEGTTIVVGGGDAQLGTIGVGVVQDGEAAIFGGSFWQYEYNTSSPKVDIEGRVRVNCHAVNDLYQYEALAFKPGLVMRWFRDAFCQLEKLEAEKTGEDVYDILNKYAKDIPAGSYGMQCTFSDIMNFMCWKHASPTFTNFELDPEKFNKYTFYRSILENTAYVTRGHVELVNGFTGKTPKYIIFASGASKSSLWSQILADVLNIEIKVPKVKEATALGAAIIAGYGVGIYKDIKKTAKELVEIEEIYKPNSENNEIYNEQYKKWKLLYCENLKIANSGLANHMWCAPGV